MEQAAACDAERDRSWVGSDEGGTRHESGGTHSRAATRRLCCVQAAGFRQRETDKREGTEEAQEVKGKEEKES